MSRIVGLEVERQQRIGAGGFLTIERVTVRNRRADGSQSRPYDVDFLVRPVGLDAIAVAIFSRARGRTEVMVRDGLRPALALGRSAVPQPVPDRRSYLLLTEVVAGIVETQDRGEEGLRRRAALEVAEEAGYQVDPAGVILLGAGGFPSPGIIGEKVWLAAAEVLDPAAQGPQDGDGSPMEEGGVTRWLDLDDAIAACVAGDIEDFKTELVLRRLRDHLAA
jgi:ADP-ribose pyrophosphatase